MNSRGRRRTGPVLLKNGFYIEVYNRGEKKGIKIRSENKKDMEHAASMYAGNKEVILLGEYKNGAPSIEVGLS